MLDKKEYGSGIPQEKGLSVFLIFSSLCVFFVNNTVFANTSKFMYTINLFVETLCILYVAKYFEYDGAHSVALFMQLVFFYLSHQLVKSILECFGGTEIDDYHNLSFPEIKINKLK